MLTAVVISPWTVYWISRLDAFDKLFGITWPLAFVGCAFLLFVAGLNDLITPTLKRLVTCLATVAALAVAFDVLVPTTKEACAIYLIPKLANNEQVQEVGMEFHKLALDWLHELKPKEILHKEVSSED